MLSSLKRIFILTVLATGAWAAQAQEERGEESRAIVPSLGIRTVFDSNIYNTSNEEIESWIGILSPSILLNTAPAKHRYALLYTGEYGSFFESSNDNYDDHSLSAFGILQFGSRGKLDLSASFENGHRDRGSNQTDGLGPSSSFFPSEPDEFNRNTWAAKFRYGADGNRGRLNFGLGGSQLDYTNNLQRTRAFDFDTLSASAGISMLVYQRTAIVLSAGYTDINYENARPGQASLDGSDWRYLLGVTWEATSKTTGSVRFGVQKREFNAASRPSTSNPSWEVDIRWSLREHSHLDLVTTRVNQETFGEGAFIDSQVSKVSWTHEWKRGWKSIFSVSLSDLVFVDSERNQDLREVYLGLRFAQSKRLNWEAGYSKRSRDSSVGRYVYDGNMFSIGLNLGT